MKSSQLLHLKELSKPETHLVGVDDSSEEGFARVAAHPSVVEVRDGGVTTDGTGDTCSAGPFSNLVSTPGPGYPHISPELSSAGLVKLCWEGFSLVFLLLSVLLAEDFLLLDST